MIKVYRSAIIHASADKVWRLVRNFNDLPKWHPAIASSEIEQGLPPDRIGCVRRFRLSSDGGLLREQLLALADDTRSFTYSILESPMPVDNYVAEMRFTPITMGDKTFAEWWAVFDVTSGQPEVTAQDIGDNVFAGGFGALNARLGKHQGRFQ
jgi:hypothetical protein